MCGTAALGFGCRTGSLANSSSWRFLLRPNIPSSPTPLWRVRSSFGSRHACNPFEVREGALAKGSKFGGEAAAARPKTGSVRGAPWTPWSMHIWGQFAIDPHKATVLPGSKGRQVLFPIPHNCRAVYPSSAE